MLLPRLSGFFLPEITLLKGLRKCMGFQKGNRSGEPYFFVKGHKNWNEGKRYRLIPPNRWSFKFEYCKKCETQGKSGLQKHYSNGLCKSCYFKELRKRDDPQKQKLR